MLFNEIVHRSFESAANTGKSLITIGEISMLMAKRFVGRPWILWPNSRAARKQNQTDGNWNLVGELSEHIDRTKIHLSPLLFCVSSAILLNHQRPLIQWQ
jgi:hypothetical protein